MGASGAESLNVAASIFMGQTDAPLTIRLSCRTSRVPKLMTVMTSGMGTRLSRNYGGLYRIRDRAQAFAQRRNHDSPGTILMSKMLVPETRAAENCRAVGSAAEEEEKEAQRKLVSAQSLAAQRIGLNLAFETLPPC